MQSLVTAQHHVHRPGLPFYAQAHPARFRCFFGESAQFLAQVIIPILDIVRSSICAVCQPPLNANHTGVTNQKSILSLSEGLIYNLLLSDLKLTKFGEQRNKNILPFNIDGLEPHTRHTPNPQNPHAGSHDKNTNI